MRQNTIMMKQLFLFLSIMLFAVRMPVRADRIIEIKFRDDAGIVWTQSGFVDAAGMPVFRKECPGTADISSASPVFSRSPEELTTDRHQAANLLNRPLPDLSQYFHARISDPDTRAILHLLRTHPSVERAVLLPIRTCTAAIPANTPDFTSFQEYLFDSSGPFISRAWHYPGGRGEGITIAVLDAHMNRHHEDLEHRLGNDEAVLGGLPGGIPGAIDHGTAVAGLLVAAENDFGITGICHQASMRIYFVDDSRLLANAIDITQAALKSGDIILIELQVAGPNHQGGDDQFGMVPVEFVPSVFDAITIACALGRTIIEPAGNGSQNLDDAVYEGIFNPVLRDSGAIIVGAGRPADRSAVSYTNHGQRITVQGWAERMNPCCQVWSTGYGDAPGSPPDSDQLYTDRFSGTSSAAAMVAGIAVCLQGAARFRAADLLTPALMRETLVQTGFPQTGSRLIGPLPDVGSAIDSIPIAQIVADLELNLRDFKAADPFILSYRTDNPLQTKAVVKYVALQCISEWFFMDCDTGSFVSYVEGCPEILNVGTHQQDLVTFEWPSGDFGRVPPESGFAFYMIYLDLFDGNPVSNLDYISFGWY